MLAPTSCPIRRHGRSGGAHAVCCGKQRPRALFPLFSLGECFSRDFSIARRYQKGGASAAAASASSFLFSADPTSAGVGFVRLSISLRKRHAH